MKIKNASSMLARSILIGGAATGFMDIASEVVRQTTGVPPLNLNFVGRWIGSMKNGKFAHESITNTDPIENEYVIGLSAHYLIGIAFAGATDLVLRGWADNPKLAPSVLAGVSTTVAPWLLMQPAFGLGFFATKTPQPMVSAYRSLRAHTFYGIGLYIGAKLLAEAKRK
ncbi:DUF2938 family protein [Corynebacterium ulcerans]|uniref:DUF2938 family protein n=1 Tax=Corynebacterium ulcerans TaxID=65058 RepID=UPI000CCAD865|nr:DUF2938 family protein [Corynebacterium ulcerans]MBH5297132.1 DUF2938 family protein [Corynebacterium ulcerans]PLW00057.1 hypothetical protein BRL53_04785 [Corynebacterium ulcerans]